MAIPKRTAKLDAMPRKQAGRSAAAWDEWADEIKALRKEKPGTVYTYENVTKPSAIAQGLKKYYNINAGSRGVDKDTMIGTLVVQNQDWEGDEDVDDSYDTE